MHKASIDRLWPVALLVTFLSGCATTPVGNADARLVPAERVLIGRYANYVPGSGEVTIKRDAGFAGGACVLRVLVNAEAVADLRPEEKVVMHMPESEYIFSVMPSGICGGGLSEAKSQVKAGSRSSYRVGYGTGGDLSINPTAF